MCSSLLLFRLAPLWCWLEWYEDHLGCQTCLCWNAAEREEPSFWGSLTGFSMPSGSFYPSLFSPNLTASALVLPGAISLHGSLLIHWHPLTWWEHHCCSNSLLKCPEQAGHAVCPQRSQCTGVGRREGKWSEYFLLSGYNSINFRYKNEQRKCL